MSLVKGAVERSRDWIAQARGDLAHARHDLDAGFHDWACFSAQQAAEKAVKAVLQRLGAEAWGHSVADLLGELASGVKLQPALMDLALELDKAYIAARYPNAHPAGAPKDRYTGKEAERLVGYAQDIVGFCEGLLASL